MYVQKKSEIGLLKEKLSLENQRSKQLSVLEPTTVSIYEKVLAARGGLAVVSLSGTSCGGCGASIPMQKVTEKKQKNSGS